MSPFYTYLKMVNCTNLCVGLGSDKRTNVSLVMRFYNLAQMAQFIAPCLAANLHFIWRCSLKNVVINLYKRQYVSSTEILIFNTNAASQGLFV